MRNFRKGVCGSGLVLAILLAGAAQPSFGKGPFDVPTTFDLKALADAQPGAPQNNSVPSYLTVNPALTGDSAPVALGYPAAMSFPGAPSGGPSLAPIGALGGVNDPSMTLPLADPLILNPAPLKDLRHEHFHWRAALRETFEFDTVMHLERLDNTDTLPDSGHGNMFVDYIRSVENLHGWDDHDRFLIQYIQHSFQGASDARIELQNNPYGRNIEWGDPGYWHSRLVSMAWNGFWGAQFKIGLYSEAMIGNVGLPNKYRKRPLPPGADYGLMAWSEFVVNPAFGTCWVIGEDLIDHYVVRKAQLSGHEYLFYLTRSFLTPSRSWANLLRFKVPWNRDTPSEMEDPLR